LSVESCWSRDGSRRKRRANGKGDNKTTDRGHRTENSRV
jgi:hypothetical protein